MLIFSTRVNGAPAQPSCFMCSLINTNNNNNNNNVNAATSNTIANTEAATPDPYISMEIGNWRETLNGVPASSSGSSSVEFSESGEPKQAQPVHALHCLAFLFILLSWLKQWPINWLQNLTILGQFCFIFWIITSRVLWKCRAKTGSNYSCITLPCFPLYFFDLAETMTNQLTALHKLGRFGHLFDEQIVFSQILEIKRKTFIDAQKACFLKSLLCPFSVSLTCI